MERRRAIGATLASIVLFGSLVTSNFALVSGSQEHLQLVSVSDQEDALYSRASVALGTSVLAILDSLQEGLSSGAFPCIDASSALSRLVEAQAINVGSNSLEVRAVARTSTNGASSDNLSSLAPFAGFVPGRLDLSVYVTEIGASPGGLVSYHKTEAHSLNIPIHPVLAASLCLASASEVASALSDLGQGMCNSTSLGAAMLSLRAALARSSSLLGFSSSLSYSMEATPSCSVSYRLVVSQEGVAGPLGPFSWSVDQAGSASP